MFSYLDHPTYTGTQTHAHTWNLKFTGTWISPDYNIYIYHDKQHGTVIYRTLQEAHLSDYKTLLSIFYKFFYSWKLQEINILKFWSKVYCFIFCC